MGFIVNNLVWHLLPTFVSGMPSNGIQNRSKLEADLNKGNLKMIAEGHNIGAVSSIEMPILQSPLSCTA